MKERIRIGYIGLGRRGKDVLRTCFSRMKDVEVVMLCDTYEPYLEEAQKVLKENAGYEAILTQRDDDIFENPEIDAVVIMTGWNDRVQLVKKSMRAGKYTAFEVGCAFRLEECFELLEVYKETKMPIMMLENCCYGRLEMMALNMHSQGLFGDIIHCEGGYHHYLEVELLQKMPPEHPHYRIQSYIERNCEQYPTHELGPICKVLGINRGNRMVKLSSFASKTGGLKECAKSYLGEDDYYANIDYKQADIITTIITCANGETVKICLDTTLPRAYYSRNFTVRGTKGLCEEGRRVAFFRGMKEGVENNLQEMYEKYDHPLWEEYHKIVSREGHGGMDYLVCRAFVESVKNGTDTPIDVYDSLLMLAIAPLSEKSIELGGMPVEIPDFTEGKWQHREPVVEGKYCLDQICKDPDTPIL